MALAGRYAPRPVPPHTSNDEDALLEQDRTEDLPAPPPVSGADAPSGNGHRPARSGRRGWAWGVAIVLLGLSFGLAVSDRLGEGLLDRIRPTVSPATPARTHFSFGEPRVRTTAFGAKPSRRAIAGVAEEVRLRLSEFYDGGFVDPATWTDGVSDGLWDAFTDDAAARAKKDAGSLVLGRQPELSALEVTEAKLTVYVLFDQHRRSEAAVATTRFRATGSLSDGSSLEVVNDATFLLRRVSGRWLVAGFPSARTELRSMPPPSPTPSAGPSSTGGKG